MMTLLLDTHVLLWLGAEPDRLSSAAAVAIGQADELAVASITWFELAWLAAVTAIEQGWQIVTKDQRMRRVQASPPDDDL